MEYHDTVAEFRAVLDILTAREPGTTCGQCGREAGAGHEPDCPYR